MARRGAAAFLSTIGLAGLGLASVCSQAIAEQPDNPSTLKWPRCGHGRDFFYPPEAIQNYLQGRVLLDVVIAAGGRIKSVTVKESDADPALAEAARASFALQRCDVPSGWAAAGGETRHFLINVAYLLNDAPAPQAYVPNDGELIVRAERRMPDYKASH